MRLSLAQHVGHYKIFVSKAVFWFPYIPPGANSANSTKPMTSPQTRNGAQHQLQQNNGYLRHTMSSSQLVQNK